MDVIDDDHQRALGGEGLEEHPERPRGLLGRTPADSARGADRSVDARNDERRMIATGDQLRKALVGFVAEDLAKDLGEWPVRDAFAVREAASHDHA